MNATSLPPKLVTLMTYVESYVRIFSNQALRDECLDQVHLFFTASNAHQMRTTAIDDPGGCHAGGLYKNG